ncbi:MAG: protease pro-enzyme activation domain-containing protein, partial [Mycobacteriales bacterium]
MKARAQVSALAAMLALVASAGVVDVAGQAGSPAALAGPVALPSSTAPAGDPAILADPASYSGPALGRTVRLTADAPKWSHLTPAVGTPSSSTQIEVSVFLLGRDTVGQNAFSRALYTPGSAVYHAYLTPAQFDAAFGAEPARTAAARRWLSAGGLTVDYASPSGTLLQARGTLSRVGRLFGVSFRTYRAYGQQFISAVGAPRVPAILGVRTVLGLDGFPYIRTLAAAPSVPLSETTNPSDLWKLYNQPPNRVDGGQGQSLSSISWGTPD